MAFGICPSLERLIEVLLSLYQQIHPDTGSLSHKLTIHSALKFC